MKKKPLQHRRRYEKPLLLSKPVRLEFLLSTGSTPQGGEPSVVEYGPFRDSPRRT